LFLGTPYFYFISNARGPKCILSAYLSIPIGPAPKLYLPYLNRNSQLQFLAQAAAGDEIRKRLTQGLEEDLLKK
jgi:hypothetical protein